MRGPNTDAIGPSCCPHEDPLSSRYVIPPSLLTGAINEGAVFLNDVCDPALRLCELRPCACVCELRICAWRKRVECLIFSQLAGHRRKKVHLWDNSLTHIHAQKHSTKQPFNSVQLQDTLTHTLALQVEEPKFRCTHHNAFAYGHTTHS